MDRHVVGVDAGLMMLNKSFLNAPRIRYAYKGRNTLNCNYEKPAVINNNCVEVIDVYT